MALATLSLISTDAVQPVVNHGKGCAFISSFLERCKKIAHFVHSFFLSLYLFVRVTCESLIGRVSSLVSDGWREIRRKLYCSAEYNAMWTAINKNDAATVKQLLKQPEKVGSLGFFLAYAMQDRREEIVELLIQHDPKLLNFRPHSYSATPNTEFLLAYLPHLYQKYSAEISPEAEALTLTRNLAHVFQWRGSDLTEIRPKELAPDAKALKVEGAPGFSMQYYLSELLTKLPKNDDNETLQKVMKDGLNSLSPEQILKRIQDGEIVWLPAGYNGHAMIVIFAKVKNGHFMITCNPQDQRIQWIDQIAPSRLTVGDIQQIQKNACHGTALSSFYYLLHSLPQKIADQKLKPVGSYLDSPYFGFLFQLTETKKSWQKGGYCAFRCGLLAATCTIYLSALNEQLEKKDDEAAAEAGRRTKNWWRSSYTALQKESLEEYFTFFKKHPECAHDKVAAQLRASINSLSAKAERKFSSSTESAEVNLLQSVRQLKSEIDSYLMSHPQSN